MKLCSNQGNSKKLMGALLLGLLYSLLLVLSGCLYSAYGQDIGFHIKFIEQETGYQQNLERSMLTHRLHSTVTNLGYPPDLGKLMIDECKKQEIWQVSARNCAIWMSAIGVAESSACRNREINCWGIMERGQLKQFNSSQDSVSFWVGRFYKYRYTNKTPKQWITRSRYCVSDSDGTNQVWCPNWQRITSVVIQQFKEEGFILQ